LPDDRRAIEKIISLPSEEALPRSGATLVEKELRGPACPRATDAGTATESEGLGERAVGPCRLAKTSKVRRSSGTYTSDTMSSVGARDASPLSFGASTTPWIFGKVVFDLRRMNRSRL